jgi:hypothetical protein
MGDDRFAAHYGLQADIASDLKSADSVKKNSFSGEERKF